MNDRRLRLRGFLIACFAATVFGVAGFQWQTREWETLGAGVLASLCVVPAIAAYVLMIGIERIQGYRHFAYWMLVLGWSAFLFYVAIAETQKSYSDGSGEMAMLLGVTAVIAGAGGYGALRYAACPPDR